MSILTPVQPTVWETKAPQDLSAKSLEQLFNNEIPLIRIGDFATEAECTKLIEEANRNGFSSYQDVSPRIDRIGITVFEYDKVNKLGYFEAVNQATAVQDRITEASFHPRKRLMMLMRDFTDKVVRVASEEPYGNYYAGLIRRIERGTLNHIDFAPAEQPGWEVSTVVSQLSWNLYLRVSPPDQGKTTIYNRQWQPEDEHYKIEGTYGYTQSVIEGTESVVFQPSVGDLYIFNTRNFHIVDGMQKGERVTFTSAIGLLPSNEIVFWS